MEIECEECGKELSLDSGMSTIYRCHNKECKIFNIPIMLGE